MNFFDEENSPKSALLSPSKRKMMSMMEGMIDGDDDYYN